MKTIIFYLFFILFLTGCSNVNVVLLPEKNGKVGKIEVKDKGKTTIVDKAYQKVNVEQGTSQILTKEEIARKYENEIKALPKKPKSYLLYFQWDSSALVDKSSKTFNALIKEAKKSEISYIEVIGHTDKAGDKKYNKILSLKRATSVVKALVKNGINKEKTIVYYYGESAPLVNTADGVPRKVNRRVEVILK